MSAFLFLFLSIDLFIHLFNSSYNSFKFFTTQVYQNPLVANPFSKNKGKEVGKLLKKFNKKTMNTSMYKYIKYLYIAFLISKYLESLDNFFF